MKLISPHSDRDYSAAITFQPLVEESLGAVVYSKTGFSGKVEIDMEYDQYIDRLASTEDERTISNSTMSHALSNLCAVFRHAKSNVHIFSGPLWDRLYNNEELLLQLRSFLSRSTQTTLVVIIQGYDKTDNLEENKFLAELKCWSEKNNDRVKVLLADINSPVKNAKNSFLVADGKMYRMEVDPGSNTAIGSFNDKLRAERLNEAFENLITLNATSH